jgi:hypothetical protein
MGQTLSEPVVDKVCFVDAAPPPHCCICLYHRRRHRSWRSVRNHCERCLC